MDFSYAMNISSSHQKANQDSWCLETPQCSCSQCRTEADFGCFSISDSAMNATSSGSLKVTRLLNGDESPKIVSLYDGHRCKKFPCPICNPGRSQREGRMSQMVDQYPQARVPVVSFGDGGHRCRRFPCPVCHTGRASLHVNDL